MLESIVDIGSNSVRMTVYDCDAHAGSWEPFFKLKKQLGLASHVDPASGGLDEDGIQSLVSTINEYRRSAAHFVEMNHFACFATAAVRNSTNCQEVLARVKAECGVDVELLSGQDEARLGFLGAMWHSGQTSGVQVDVGGGSSEVLLYADGRAGDAVSVPLGSLSLFEKYVGDLLPTASEAKAIRDAVGKRVRKALGTGSVECASCIGGSARALRKVRNAWLGAQDRKAPVTRAELDEIVERVIRKPKTAMRDLLRVVPERIHTFTPGILAIQAVADNFGVSRLAVHDSGIREGYLMSRILGIDPSSDMNTPQARRHDDVER